MARGLNYEICILYSDHIEDVNLIMEKLKTSSTVCFFIVWSQRAESDCVFRETCSSIGANMITYNLNSVQHVIDVMLEQFRVRGNLTCTECGLQNLTEDALWHHLPLYHISKPNGQMCRKCPLCNERVRPNLQVHYRNCHGLCARNEVEAETNVLVGLSCFALVVVRRSYGRYLLVQEFGSSGFWLPGGRTDPGEDLVDSAIRECEEEGGVKIKITGVLQVQFHHVGQDHARLRVILFG